MLLLIESDIEWDNERGTAIVSALWLSLILALMALTMISVSRNSLLEVSTTVKLEERFLVAEAGLSIAKSKIAQRNNPWWPTSAPFKEVFLEEELLIFVASPRGKIDLNAGRGELFRQLLTGLGYDATQSAEMVDNLLDYIDEDDLVRLNGAESPDYRANGTAPEIANAPLRRVDELGSVLGFTETDVACLLPFVTIYSQSSELDFRAASSALKQVLNVQNNESYVPPIVRRGSLAGQVYEISSEVSYSKRAKVRVREIIRYTGIPSDPVWVHKHVRDIVPIGQTFEVVIPDACPSKS